MKMCPKCKKAYANRFDKCNECQESLIICTKDDLAKTTIVKEVKKTKEINLPKCPTCGSTNIRHISSTERGVNAVMFGFFGNKRKCQFECLNPNCRYRW